MADAEGRAEEARAWFAAHGWDLRVTTRDMSAALRRLGARRSPTIRHTHWADLVSRRDPTFVVPGYGSGTTEDDAVISARRRWLVEQGA